MAGNNIHSQITDQAEIHVPKGFTEAASHTGLVKNEAGQLEWRDLDSFADKSNFTATVDPTPLNDASQGYVKGSRWINTVQNNIFECINPLIGAAIWAPVIRSNPGINRSPLATDDASQGWKEGSVWIQLSSPTNIAFICMDSAIGNAEWAAVNAPIVIGIDHRTLSHMTAPADDHTQYVHIDGRRAMTGDLDIGTHSIRNVSDIYALQGDSTQTEVGFLIQDGGPVGILEGGGNGDINPPVSGFVIQVEAGVGYLHIESTQTLKKIVWPNTSFTLPASATTWLYFDATSTLQGSASMPDAFENIIIGRCVTSSTGVLIIEESGFFAHHAASAIGQSLRNAFGAVYVSGSTIAEAGTRTLNVAAGEYYFGERQFLANGGNPVTFTSFYQNGSGGFTVVPGQTVVDNAFWDNGTGTLAALGAGNYAKHSIYCLGDSTNDFDSEAYFLVYSQAQYTALTLAEQGNLPNPPAFLNQAVSLIASVIVQQGQTHLAEIRDERPIISSKRISTVAATTFHHNLQGLNDFDDHSRYLPVDGSRPMLASLDFGTHKGINAVDPTAAQDVSTKNYTDITSIINAFIFG